METITRQRCQSRKRNIMQRTNKHNQFFGNGLIITDSKIWLSYLTAGGAASNGPIIAKRSNAQRSRWGESIRVFIIRSYMDASMFASE